MERSLVKGCGALWLKFRNGMEEMHLVLLERNDKDLTTNGMPFSSDDNTSMPFDLFE